MSICTNYTRGMVENNTIFRESAVARTALPEPLDNPLRVTAPHEWLALAALALALLGALLWAALAGVERTLSGSGALVRAGERHAVVAPVSGTVAEVLADAGDRVEAGQPILRLRLPEIEWRLRIAETRVDLLEAEAEHIGDASGGPLREEIAVARAELADLAALETVGQVIVSPHAGEVAVRHPGAGQAVAIGETVAEILVRGDNRPHALLVIGADQRHRIADGMEARVAVPFPGLAGGRIVATEVAQIVPLPVSPPPWLVRFGLLPPESGNAQNHLVRLALPMELPQVPDGTSCEVEIVLSRHSPLGLLASTAGDPS